MTKFSQGHPANSGENFENECQERITAQKLITQFWGCYKVQQQLGTTLTAIVPSLIEGLQAWIAGGQQGPPPVPSFMASNSHNAQAAPLVSPAEVVLVSPAPARALELNAPVCTPAGTSTASGPSVSCTPAIGGASTLAELDSITVTKPLGR